MNVYQVFIMGQKMNDLVYQMYKSLRKLIERSDKCKEQHGDEPLYKEWKMSVETLDAGDINYAERYEREKTMTDSFTPAQIDFICYQIGDWYIEWQDKMWVEGKPNQHWLGRAKEQLKTMICGE